MGAQDGMHHPVEADALGARAFNGSVRAGFSSATVASVAVLVMLCVSSIAILSGLSSSDTPGRGLEALAKWIRDTVTPRDYYSATGVLATISIATTIALANLGANEARLEGEFRKRGPSAVIRGAAASRVLAFIEFVIVLCSAQVAWLAFLAFINLGRGDLASLIGILGLLLSAESTAFLVATMANPDLSARYSASDVRARIEAHRVIRSRVESIRARFTTVLWSWWLTSLCVTIFVAGTRVAAPVALVSAMSLLAAYLLGTPLVFESNQLRLIRGVRSRWMTVVQCTFLGVFTASMCGLVSLTAHQRAPSIELLIVCVALWVIVPTAASIALVILSNTLPMYLPPRARRNKPNSPGPLRGCGVIRLAAMAAVLSFVLLAIHAPGGGIRSVALACTAALSLTWLAAVRLPAERAGALRSATIVMSAIAVLPSAAVMSGTLHNRTVLLLTAPCVVLLELARRRVESGAAHGPHWPLWRYLRRRSRANAHKRILRNIVEHVTPDANHGGGSITAHAPKADGRRVVTVSDGDGGTDLPKE